jgi:hypothetical protein
MSRVNRAAKLLFVFLVIGKTSPAGAQHISPGVAVGTAVPTGDLGRERSPGPVAQLYLVVGRPDRIARFQITAEGVWCPGKLAPASLSSSAYGNFRALSLLGSLLLAPASAVKPYLSLGAGLQALSIQGTRNPYGRLVGVRSGVGIEAPLRETSVRAEVGAHAVLSDFGTGHDFRIATYVPVTLAIQF